MDIQTFKRQYQIEPIALVNGIAQQQAGNGRMSILALTEGSASANYADDNEYFAHFRPMSGATLIDFTPAEFPYASMSMAANAMIQNALRFSLRMESPARNNAHNYTSIQQTITQIQQRLQQHILLGGTFDVSTPGFIYQNCLLTALRDVSSAGDKKVQGAWQWDFVQPLITAQAANQTFNGLYARLAGGLPVTNPPTNSGVSNTVGNVQTNQPRSLSQTGAAP